MNHRKKLYLQGEKFRGKTLLSYQNFPVLVIKVPDTDIFIYCTFLELFFIVDDEGGLIDIVGESNAKPNQESG